jgi:hypothetical protein
MEKRITRSRTKKLLSENLNQDIAANNLLILNFIKIKLKTIAEKILQSVPLSQSENIFLNSSYKQ